MIKERIFKNQKERDNMVGKNKGKVDFSSTCNSSKLCLTVEIKITTLIWFQMHVYKVFNVTSGGG